MRSIHDHIKTAKQLQSILVRLVPKDVYVSCSKWLNPSVLGPMRYDGRRAGHNLAYSFFLGSDFIADIDKKHQTPPTLDAAYNTLISFYNFIKKEYGFEKFKFVKTGNGFQCWILDFDKMFKSDKRWVNKKNPLDRRTIYFQAKYRIVRKLEKNKIRIDYPLSHNNYHVFRVWNTVHGGSQTVIQAFDAPFELLNGDNSLKVLPLSDALKSGEYIPKGYTSPSIFDGQMMSTTFPGCCEKTLACGKGSVCEGGTAAGIFFDCRGELT